MMEGCQIVPFLASSFPCLHGMDYLCPVPIPLSVDPQNILSVRTRSAFRHWLTVHHGMAKECWFEVSKRREPPPGVVPYLDAVEEALCFGWIDSIHKCVGGIQLQRFTPRRPGSVWSELNKARCRRLEQLGLMTDAGRAVLPDMGESGFVISPDVLAAFQACPEAWDRFCRMPALYQRVRIDTVQRDRSDEAVFRARLAKLIASAAQGKLMGEWNDGGRLLGY